MPAIFNEQQKEAMRQRMLDNGFQLIKKYGLKRMTIESVAKSAGLAKGIFYTFFPPRRSSSTKSCRPSAWWSSKS